MRRREADPLSGFIALRTTRKGWSATTVFPQQHHHSAGPARHGALSPHRGAVQAVTVTVFALNLGLVLTWREAGRAASCVEWSKPEAARGCEAVPIELRLTLPSAALERSGRDKRWKSEGGETTGCLDGAMQSTKAQLLTDVRRKWLRGCRAHHL